MEDPKQEVDRKRSGHEERQDHGNLSEDPATLLGLRRLRLFFLLDLAGAAREVVDDARLDDELAGLQPVHVVLPIPPAADDTGIGEAAPEQIDDPLGDGPVTMKPITGPTGRGSTMMLKMSGRCGGGSGCSLWVLSMRSLQRATKTGSRDGGVDACLPISDPLGSRRDHIKCP